MLPGFPPEVMLACSKIQHFISILHVLIVAHNCASALLSLGSDMMATSLCCSGLISNLEPGHAGQPRRVCRAAVASQPRQTAGKHMFVSPQYLIRQRCHADMPKTEQHWLLV